MDEAKAAPSLPTRDDFTVMWAIPTRWADNDHYGHVNNAAYYAYLDTAVNAWLMEATDTDTRLLPEIGVVVSSRCEFKSSAGFPDVLQIGMAVAKIGHSSVAYQLAVFRESDGELCAIAEFVHVYVDEQTRRPVAMPEGIRAVVESLPRMQFFASPKT